MKRDLFIFLFMFSCGLLLAQTSQPASIVYKLDIKKEIGSTTWVYTQRGLTEAEALGTSCVVLHLNTYGGEVKFADSIRTRILRSEIPVYAFVDNNAASAGALIAIACEKIYMHPSASMGAATVVNQTGEQMPDKYQSYMRATMRATAEARGRNPQIAEAMVDDRIVIPEVIDSGRTLTFTTQEALRHGYCDAEVGDLKELLMEHLQNDTYTLVEYEPTWYDQLKGFLGSSLLQGLLIMLIVGGIYFELQTPGVGFPLAASIVAAVLYFASLYIDGLAGNWEILIFVVGLVLIALEIFVIPGFGIAGISGIVFVVAGLTFSLLANDGLDFTFVDGSQAISALFTVVVGVSGGFLLICLLASRIGAKGLFRTVALSESLPKEQCYIDTEDLTSLVGATAVTLTVLRPSGKLKVGDRVYDAISEGRYVAANVQVRIIRHASGQLYVEEI